MKKIDVYIGADHRGFTLKEKIKKYLFEKGISFFDVGAGFLDPKDDYVKYAAEVALLVRDNKDARGIVLCGSGVGVDIVSNKFDGIRAGLAKSDLQIKKAREDDDINILVIAADFTEEKEALEITETFLKTKFSKEERHKRRVEDISKLEANN